MQQQTELKEKRRKLQEQKSAEDAKRQAKQQGIEKQKVNLNLELQQAVSALKLMASAGDAEKTEAVDKNIKLQDLKKQINGVFKQLKGGSSNPAEKKAEKPKNKDQKTQAKT